MTQFNDDNLIYERYLLNELFDSFYNIDEIQAVFAAGRTETFNNFDKIFKFHLKHRENNPVNYIKCSFKNNSREDIEVIIHPSVFKNNIFSEDVLETFVIFFRPSYNNYKLKLNSFDANIIVATVIYISLIFLNSYKNLIDSTTKDWNIRSTNGFIKFEIMSNQTMNKVSKQLRIKKEEDRGYSQRENLYRRAFDKIIKPSYPNLSIKKHENYFVIKS
jgi:hypothetical protein